MWPIQIQHSLNDDAAYQYKNVTLPGHVFYYGEVLRQAISLSNGGVGITTDGTGNGACPILNEAAGVRIFYVLDVFLACHLAGGCHPVP